MGGANVHFIPAWTARGTINFMIVSCSVLIKSDGLTVGLFIKSKSNKYANSILVLISGTLLTAPFLTGFTDQTNQPYRLLPLIVFFSVAVGIIFAKRSSR